MNLLNHFLIELIESFPWTKPLPSDSARETHVSGRNKINKLNTHTHTHTHTWAHKYICTNTHTYLTDRCTHTLLNVHVHVTNTHDHCTNAHTHTLGLGTKGTGSAHTHTLGLGTKGTGSAHTHTLGLGTKGTGSYLGWGTKEKCTHMPEMRAVGLVQWVDHGVKSSVRSMAED